MYNNNIIAIIIVLIQWLGTGGVPEGIVHTHVYYSREKKIIKITISYKHLLQNSVSAVYGPCNIIRVANRSGLELEIFFRLFLFSGSGDEDDFPACVRVCRIT